jgi:hypothetical protein
MQIVILKMTTNQHLSITVYRLFLLTRYVHEIIWKVVGSVVLHGTLFCIWILVVILPEKKGLPFVFISVHGVTTQDNNIAKYYHVIAESN